MIMQTLFFQFLGFILVMVGFYSYDESPHKKWVSILAFISGLVGFIIILGALIYFYQNASQDEINTWLFWFN